MANFRGVVRARRLISEGRCHGCGRPLLGSNERAELEQQLAEARKQIEDFRAYEEGHGDKFDAFCHRMRKRALDETAKRCAEIADRPVDGYVWVHAGLAIRREFGLEPQQ